MFASLLRNPGRGRSTQSLSRSTRLGVEVLEGRSVPSASRIAVVEAPTLATSDWPPPPGRPAQVSRMTVDAGQIEVMLSRGSLEEIPSFCGQNAGQIELLGRRGSTEEIPQLVGKNAEQIELFGRRGSTEEIPQFSGHDAFHIGEEIPQFTRLDAFHIGEEIPQFTRLDAFHIGEEIPQ